MSFRNAISWAHRVATYDARSASGAKGFSAFNGLRGYMAWWVVIGHALHLCGLNNLLPGFLSRGDVAVNVFICLSGFVITHLLLEKRESYGRYIVRRAFRILPIYWFALGCAIAFSGAYQFVYQSDWVYELPMRLARQASTEAHFGTHLALHLGLLHGLIPDTWLPFSSSSLLAPAWSLSLEWQFYLVAPLLVGCLVHPGWPRVAGFALIVALWITFKKISPLQWQYPAFLPLALHFFTLGILSRAFMPLLSRLYAWIVPAALAVSALAPHSVSLEIAIWGIFLCSACIEFRSMRGEGTGSQLPRKLLSALTSNRIATSLREFSYSTYLIHIPLFSLFGWSVAQATGEWNQRLCVVSTAAAVIVLVPLSFLLYRHIEHRFILIGSTITKARLTSTLKAG
ncbi:acyltransferase family protein [Methylibium sp.]|jgi:peptidoglycan/LPS O-acetylase OafA/YrhL|uniref:acyltransferase family protein n=1 Tax=Methylibium sp. TaxID=2067992 RepID=UPI003D0A195E